MTESWTDVAASNDLTLDAAVEVLVADRVVAVFRTEQGLFAVDGMCAHQGGPLAEGTVDHGCVTCPWHGWQYELETGIQTINRQPLQEVFEVREQSGRIQVRPRSGIRPRSGT